MMLGSPNYLKSVLSKNELPVFIKPAKFFTKDFFVSISCWRNVCPARKHRKIFFEIFAIRVGRFASSLTPGKAGGDNRDRTGNLQLAKLALSQLSYIPI